MKAERNRLKRIVVVIISLIAITTSIIRCGDLRFLPHIPETSQIKRMKDVDRSDVPRGIFKYGGSTTFAPIRGEKFIEAINKAHPQFKLHYTEPEDEKPGSGTGIKMLLEGQLDFSQSSRPVKPEEFKRAEEEGFKLREIPVAIDAIAFYVNPKLINLGVKYITLEQAQKIFIGEIQNWQDLRGPNIRIVPFSRNLQAGGTVDFFYEKVLEKESFGQNVQEIQDTTEGIRRVATTLGGIGYATASEVINQETIHPLSLAQYTDSSPVSPCETDTCKSVNQKAFKDYSYPLTRRLFVVIKKDGKLDEKAGIAYKNLLLTNEGQKLIKNAGFVPIRKTE